MTSQVEQFLRALHPNADVYRELRAISTDRKTVRDFNFPADDFAGVKSFLTAPAMQGLNIFVGVAGRRASKGGTLADCGHLHVLFADLDFKTTTEAEARRRLAEFAFEPSIIIHTGGGLHVYWLLDVAIDLQRHPRRAKAWLRALAQTLSGDLGAATPERILRIPDTLNYKYDPPRPITIEVFEPERRYRVEDISAAIGEDYSDHEERKPAAKPNHGLSIEERVALAKAYVAKQSPAISGKGGDNHTFHVAASVAIGHDLDADRSYAVLTDRWNGTCEPPWEPDELKTKIRNAIRYGDKSTRGSKLMDRQRPRFVLLPEADLLARPAAPFLVKGLLVDGSLTALVSPPDTGKTFIALDLMASIASRQPTWLGHTLRRHGPVVYVMGEGAGRFKYRHLAWKQMHGIAEPLPFYTLEQAVPLLDTEARKEFLSLVTPLRPVAIVFDTLSRCISGADENSQAAMSEAMAACDEIRAATGSWIGLLHHTKKDGTVERGSSVLRAAVDTVILLGEDKDTDGLLTLVCDRQKDAEKFAPIDVERRVVQLDGVLEDGDPVTSCVIRLASKEDEAKLRTKPNKRDVRILDWVRRHPECSKTGVAEGIGGRTRDVLKAVDRLVDRGLLARNEGGRLQVPGLLGEGGVHVSF